MSTCPHFHISTFPHFHMWKSFPQFSQFHNSTRGKLFHIWKTFVQFAQKVSHILKIFVKIIQKFSTCGIVEKFSTCGKLLLMRHTGSASVPPNKQRAKQYKSVILLPLHCSTLLLLLGFY